MATEAKLDIKASLTAGVLIMTVLEHVYDFFGMPGMPPWVSIIGLVIIATSPLVFVKLRRGSDWFRSDD